MAGKINIFNLGSLGVDLVKSPLHIPDGAWTQLQNGEFNPVGAQGAIKKRGALMPINSVALAGAVRTLMNVPLPIETTKVLMVALTAIESPNGWKKSTDGAAYTNLLAANVPIALQDKAIVGFATVGGIGCRPASIGRLFIYAGNDYIPYADPGHTAPPVLLYNGVSAYELFRIPPNPTSTAASNCMAILGMHVSNNLVYLGVLDHGGVAPNLKGRVLSLDPYNGVLSEIGNRFGDGSGENSAGCPFSLASYQGKLWAGTYGSSGNNQGKIYSILPGVDDAWLLDHTATIHNGYYLDMIAYNGKLYAATDADSAGTAVIEQRTAAGVWTTSKSAPTNNVSQFYGLIVFDGNLYCGWRGTGGTQVTIFKFDGTTWTTDLDVTATFGGSIAAPTQPFVYNSKLYYPVPDSSVGGQDGYLLQRTTAGVWTRAIDNIGIRGALGRYTPDAT